MASNPIGEIPVLITGDFSELQDSITNAVSVAEDGAQSISSAFDISSMGDDAVAAMQSIADAASSLQENAQQTGEALETMGAQSTEDLTNLADAAQGASTAVSAIADSSGEAASGLNDVSGAASEAASSAEEAGGGLQDMAEQLAAVGEGLAITEGLREFGEEALTAYGAVQTLTIGLTALTGSAETADSIVEDVKNLAATEPFAFPEIAPTIQRMVAMGVAAGQVDDVMQAVGGAAAATGEQFSQVAQMFDRMSISGMANTRSMATLGLSTTELGNAMGVTADEATAAFKALDQSARIDALTTALAKFAGVAEAEAQGIAGQWQIFENQFEEVMVGVGQALAPAVEGVLAFGKSVMEGIQQALDWFNQLPLPIREVAGALGLVIPAVVLLTTGLSALGFAAIGVQGAITAVSAVMKALGLSSTEAAAGSTAEAEAAGEVAVAETASATAKEASAAASTELATATEASAASQVAAAEAATGLVLQETALSTETVASATALGTFLTGLGTVASIVAGPIAALLALQSNLGDLKDKYQDLYTTIIDESIGDAIQKGSSLTALEQVGYTLQQIKGYFQNTGQVATSVFQDIQNSTVAPIAALNQVGISTAQIQTALKGIQVDGIPAFAALSNASSIAQFEATLASLGGNLSQIIQKLNQIPAATATATSGFAGAGLGITVLKTATDEYTAGEQTLIDKQAVANQAVTDAHTVMVTMAADLKDGYVSQDEYNQAVVAYDNAVSAATPHSKDFQTSIEGIEQAAVKAQQAFTSSVAVYNQVDAQFQNGTATLAALSDAYSKAEAAAKKAGDAWGSSAGEYALLSTAFAQSQATFSAVDGALDSITQKFNDGAVGVNQYLDAYTKWQAAAKGAGDVAVTVEGQVAALTNAAALQTGTLAVNVDAWGQLHLASLTNTNDIAAADAAFKLVKTDAGDLGITITQVGQGFTLMSQAATPAAQAAVKALADMMTQAGLTVQTIQNGIPVVTDAATGITMYGQALTKVAGTVIDAKTGIIELNTALPAETAGHTAAATAATSHAAALGSLTTATKNVGTTTVGTAADLVAYYNLLQPNGLMYAADAKNADTFSLSVTNLGKTAQSTAADWVAYYNLLQPNGLMYAADAKQADTLQSAITGVAIAAKDASQPFVITSETAQEFADSLQNAQIYAGYMSGAVDAAVPHVTAMQTEVDGTTHSVDVMVQGLDQTVDVAPFIGTALGDIAGDYDALGAAAGAAAMQVEEANQALEDSQSGFGAVQGTGSLSSLSIAAAMGQNAAGVAGPTTSAEGVLAMEAAGYIQTANKSFETIAEYNAQIADTITQLNAALGANSKEVYVVTTYMDQFGNEIDSISQTTNPNYSSSVVAATTATTAQTTATTAQTTATTDQTTATTDLTTATTAQTTAAANAVPVTQAMTTAATSASQAAAAQANVVQNLSTSFADTNDILTTTQNNLGQWSASLSNGGSVIDQYGQVTEDQLISMGLSVSDAAAAIQGLQSNTQDLTAQQAETAGGLQTFQQITANSANALSALTNGLGAATAPAGGGVGPTGQTLAGVGNTQNSVGANFIPPPGAAPGSDAYNTAMMQFLYGGSYDIIDTGGNAPAGGGVGPTGQTLAGVGNTQNSVGANFIPPPGAAPGSDAYNTAMMQFLYGGSYDIIDTGGNAPDLAASQTASAFGQTMNLPAWEQQQINMQNAGTYGENLAPQTPSSMTVPNMSVGTLTQTNPQTVQPVLNLTVQAGNILGDNGIQQFSSMIMQQVTTLLRQTAGQKLS